MGRGDEAIVVIIGEMSSRIVLYAPEDDEDARRWVVTTGGVIANAGRDSTDGGSLTGCRDAMTMLLMMTIMVRTRMVA